MNITVQTEKIYRNCVRQLKFLLKDTIIMAQEEYQFDEASVQAIMHWAETAQLPKEVVLSESEHIYDTSLYVRANINDIKQHYPDAFYNPAIIRLYRLKEFIDGTG